MSNIPEMASYIEDEDNQIKKSKLSVDALMLEGEMNMGGSVLNTDAKS